MDSKVGLLIDVVLQNLGRHPLVASSSICFLPTLPVIRPLQHLTLCLGTFQLLHV